MRLSILLLFAIAVVVSSFAPTGIATRRRLVDSQLKARREESQTGGDVVSRSLFSLVEVLGSIRASIVGQEGGEGANGKEEKEAKTQRKNKQSRFDLVAAEIKQEYERIFWATGNMNTDLWASDCFFADPFSSFGGKEGVESTKRFLANAQNLGRLVKGARIKITSFEANEEESTVSVGWIFSSSLDLWWTPVLAAQGITKHTLDKDSLLITRYEEKWISDPWQVVFRLFKPGKMSSSS